MADDASESIEGNVEQLVSFEIEPLWSVLDWTDVKSEKQRLSCLILNANRYDKLNYSKYYNCNKQLNCANKFPNKFIIKYILFNDKTS